MANFQHIQFSKSDLVINVKKRYVSDIGFSENGPKKGKIHENLYIL